jgi:hypothetical protein
MKNFDVIDAFVDLARWLPNSVRLPSRPVRRRIFRIRRLHYRQGCETMIAAAHMSPKERKPALFQNQGEVGRIYHSARGNGCHTSKTLNRTFDSIVFSGGVIGSRKRILPVNQRTKGKRNPVASVKVGGLPQRRYTAELFEKVPDLKRKMLWSEARLLNSHPASWEKTGYTFRTEAETPQRVPMILL